MIYADTITMFYGETNITLWNKNVDIKYSAHDAFSSGMLEIQSLESKLI
jgi:hypothetical protein